VAKAQEVEILPERKREDLVAEAASAKSGCNLPAEELRRRTGQENGPGPGVMKAANESFPTGSVLDLIEEKVALLSCQVGMQFGMSFQDQVKIRGPQGMEAVIFEIELHQLPAVDTGGLESPEEVKEDEGLSAAADPHQDDHLTRVEGRLDPSRSDGRQRQFFRLLQDIFEPFLVHKERNARFFP